jgi:hypothetical protein
MGFETGSLVKLKYWDTEEGFSSPGGYVYGANNMKDFGWVHFKENLCGVIVRPGPVASIVLFGRCNVLFLVANRYLEKHKTNT